MALSSIAGHATLFSYIYLFFRVIPKGEQMVQISTAFFFQSDHPRFVSKSKSFVLFLPTTTCKRGKITKKAHYL